MPAGMQGAFEKVGVRAVVEGFSPYMRNLGKMESKTKGFGGQLGKLGKMAVATGAGFIAAQVGMEAVRNIMSKSIGAAVAYEAQMAEIRALTGATEKDTDLLTVAIKDMTKNMPKGPEELGAAAYFILSSGIEDAAEAAEVLDVAARASTIGLGETAAVADALTTVLNAYGKEASEAGHVTDVMIEAVKQGKAEADAFAGVLGRVVPLAAQMGISFEEVAANLATFTRLGVSADEAATGLRQVMASLLKPTEDQEEAMEELGFTAEGLRQQIKDKGLLVTLDAMMKATGGNEAAVARLFPNIRALTSVLGTAGVQMEGYTDILAATSNATGNLEEGFAIVADTAKFKMGVAMNELNLMLMELGEQILPALVPAMRAVVFAAQTLGEALLPIVRTIELISAGFAGLPSKQDLVTQKLQEMAANAEVTERQFIELAQDGLDLTRKEAEKLAADTTFRTQMDVWRATADRFGISLEGLSGDQAHLSKTTDEVVTAMRFEQRELRGVARAASDASTETATLTERVNALVFAITQGSVAQQEMRKSLSDLTGARTAEENALDQQINALALEHNAALMSEVGQSSLGGATTKATDAIDKQVGALKNLAASMVSQALRNETIALDRELKVLQLARAEIEAQINARNRLAQALLSMTRVANLPALAKQKKLELDRAKILETVGGNVDDLTEEQKDAIAVIDKEIKALQSSIDVRVLEAEVTNLQAEASDENREAMQGELNELLEQIGATEDLKRQRDLYIDTLVPLELLQEIDELGRQREALGNAETGAKNFGGAIETASGKIQDQIDKLQLERDKLDLVKKGWELVGAEMLGLPTIADIGAGLKQFKALLVLQLFASLQEALKDREFTEAARLGALMAQVNAITFAQHGFHGTVTGPKAFYVEPGQTERVDITPQAQVMGAPMLAPSAPPQAALPAAGGTNAADLATAVALALQGVTVEMDGRIVGALVNDRIGDRTFQLGRGG